MWQAYLPTWIQPYPTKEQLVRGDYGFSSWLIAIHSHIDKYLKRSEIERLGLQEVTYEQRQETEAGLREAEEHTKFCIMSGEEEPETVCESIFEAILLLAGGMNNLTECHKNHREMQEKNARLIAQGMKPQEEFGGGDSYVSFFQEAVCGTVRYLRWLRDLWPLHYATVVKWLSDPQKLADHCYHKVLEHAPKGVVLPLILPCRFISKGTLDKALHLFEIKMQSLRDPE